MVGQSMHLGQRFLNPRQHIEDCKDKNAYLPGVTVSFQKDEELKEAIWELKCRVEKHVDILEGTRKVQVELLTCGLTLQA